MNDERDMISHEEFSTDQESEVNVTEDASSALETDEESKSLTPEEETEVSDFPEEKTEVSDFPEEELVISDISGATSEEGKEAPKYRNLWDDPDFPKWGWECIGMTDHGEERIICGLCGQQNVRYAHHMRHPQYGELTAGCTCAGKMECDFERARQREREYKANGTQPSVQAPPKVPYHERFYLHYHEGLRTVPQDLKGTNAFLKQIGFDGGELKQARAGESLSDNMRGSDKFKNNQMYCSYCGIEIVGVEYYRLPDGRMRCTTCSGSIVKTKAEVEEICRRVIMNLENFFGATIDVPISIEVVDERKLKKKLGLPLGTIDNQSMLILGAAVNKKNKFKIVLENGAPRISLIATFAHELTHIWQYVNWDNRKEFKKCSNKKRLLIYEGMAKWVEIQYLYLVGETNVAKREEYITRNRRDEYGVGFCLYEDRYPLSREAMTCEDTPFTLNGYPLD